jgi:hypothetical protein
MSCWAAAIAMIISWARGERITPYEVAVLSNRINEYNKGLEPLDSGIFAQWGMVTEAPQTFTEEGFLDLLRNYGPIWVAAKVFAAHIRVVTGFEPTAAPAYGLVTINDPLDKDMKEFRLPNTGSAYTETYVKFVDQNEKLGFAEMSVNDPIRYPVYFAHLAQLPDQHLR